MPARLLQQQQQPLLPNPLCPPAPVPSALSHQHWPLEVPRARHTGHQVVTQPIGKLGQAVGRQGRNHIHICPAAQLDVHDRVPHGLPGVPLVLVVCYGAHRVWQLLLREEIEGGLGAGHLDVTAQCHQQLAQLRHLDGCDTAWGVLWGGRGGQAVFLARRRGGGRAVDGAEKRSDWRSETMQMGACVCFHLSNLQGPQQQCRVSAHCPHTQ
jgi:hypothetical protein